MSSRRISAHVLWIAAYGGRVTVILRDHEEVLRVSSTNLGYASICRSLEQARSTERPLELWVEGTEIVRVFPAAAA